MKWKKSKSSGRGQSWVNYDSIQDNTLRLQITKADDMYEVHLFRRMARTITDYILLKQLPQSEIKKITDKILKTTDIKSTAGQLNSKYKKYADMKHVKPYIEESIMKLTRSKLKEIIREELLNERELEGDLQTLTAQYFEPFRKDLIRYARHTTDPKWKKAIDLVMRDLDKSENRFGKLSRSLGIIPLK